MEYVRDKRIDAAAERLRQGKKERVRMDGNNIVIRPVCRDDLQDLWENVYSAMTPRQITENVILPAVEKGKNAGRASIWSPRWTAGW